MAASVYVSSAETKAIDTVFEQCNDASEEEVHPCWKPIPKAANQVASVLAGISPTLDDQELYKRLKASSELGKYKVSIGSTNAMDGEYLVTDDDDSTVQTENEMSDDQQTLDDLFESVTRGEVDLDGIMASAAHAGRSKGVDAAHLSKMWRIDLKSAKRTLEVTSQNSKRTDDPTLSRNYGTNDRMLRYKRIDEYFFMDTFFATKKAGKSSRGHTCCQLFVTDKGFVYVVPMKSKKEALQAVKQFAKEIGAPDALICDMSGEQTSHALKRFCQ